MIFSPHRRDAQEVDLVFPGEALDSYGDPVESWAEEDVLRTPLLGAWVQHRSTTETSSPGRQTVTVEALLLVPGDPGIREGHRIDVDGETYTVEGRPAVRRNLSGISHTSAELRRVTGGSPHG